MVVSVVTVPVASSVIVIWYSLMMPFFRSLDGGLQLSRRVEGDGLVTVRSTGGAEGTVCVWGGEVWV